MHADYFMVRMITLGTLIELHACALSPAHEIGLFSTYIVLYNRKK